MGSEPGSSFLFAHDLFRPSFARQSGLREGGKPDSTFPESAPAFLLAPSDGKPDSTFPESALMMN
jgi:hypothetical protein